MTDPGIRLLTGQGELEIDGFTLSTEAWWTLDLSPLWGPPATRGGPDSALVIPGAAGRLARPARVDQTTHALIMHITGACDENGSPNSDPVMGLARNLDYLWAFVVSPPTPPATTRDALLTMPDGSMRAAEVQLRLELGALVGAYDKTAALLVTIPAGRFVEVAS